MSKITVAYKNGAKRTLVGALYEFNPATDTELVVVEDNFLPGVHTRTRTVIDRKHLAYVLVSNGSHDKRLITFGKKNVVSVESDVYIGQSDALAVVGLKANVPLDATPEQFELEN